MELGLEREAGGWLNVNKQLLHEARLSKLKVTDEVDELKLYSELEADIKIKEQEDAEGRAQLVLATLEAAFKFGLRLRNPLRVLDFAPLLYNQKANHHCSSLSCEYFHLAKHTRYFDPYTNLPATSRGQYFICRSTGHVHRCVGFCEAAITNNNADVPDGYICAISNRFIAVFYDDMPSGKDVRMAPSTIERYKNSNRIRSAMHRGHDDEADSEGDSQDYVEDAPIRKLSDKEKAEERKKQRRRERRVKESVAAGLGHDVVHSDSDIEESSDAADEWLEEPETKAATDAVPETADQMNTTMPQVPGGSTGRRKTAPSAAPPSALLMQIPEVALGVLSPNPKATVNVVDTEPLGSHLPSDPNERTAHFLANPEKRKVEIERLLAVLLSYTSHQALWIKIANQESDRAHSLYPAYLRRHGLEHSSYVDRYTHWMTHMATYCPPAPKRQDPLNITNYRNLILKAWWLVANSPYTRIAGRTRIIPNLTNICLGLLYTMIDGARNFDCSLNPISFPNIPTALEEVDLQNFFVGVLPSGIKVLKKYLLDMGLLEEMAKITQKRYKLSIPKKAKGLRCFRDAVISTIQNYRDELKSQLQAVGTNQIEAYLEYIAKCKLLACTIPIEESTLDR